MATPILGGTAFDFGAAAQAPAVQPPTTTTSVATVKQPAGVEPVADTVKVSDRAEVRLLETQGQTVPQISVITNLSTQAVDSYLGIAQAPLPPVTGSNQ